MTGRDETMDFDDFMMFEDDQPLFADAVSQKLAAGVSFERVEWDIEGYVRSTGDYMKTMVDHFVESAKTDLSDKSLALTDREYALECVD